MNVLLKHSGLNGLKGSIQFCADCQKPSLHYRLANGWPVCHACGYNPMLMKLVDHDQPCESAEPLASNRPARGRANYRY